MVPFYVQVFFTAEGQRLREFSQLPLAPLEGVEEKSGIALSNANSLNVHAQKLPIARLDWLIAKIMRVAPPSPNPLKPRTRSKNLAW